MCILNNQKNHNLYHHPFQGNIVPLISGNTYGHFHQIALSLPFVLYYFQLVLIFFGYMIVFCALSYKKNGQPMAAPTTQLFLSSPWGGYQPSASLCIGSYLGESFLPQGRLMRAFPLLPLSGFAALNHLPPSWEGFFHPPIGKNRTGVPGTHQSRKAS